MKRVPLGRTELRVSRVGFGGGAIGGHEYGAVDDATSIAAVHRALDAGINFFDTADIYGLGHSETILGRALAGRDDVVVGTKVGVRWDPSGRSTRDLSAAWIREALEGSLRRLRLDAIPLYQIHWPNDATPIEAAMETLQRCREAGHIRHIGLCNVGDELLARAAAVAPVESLQVTFGLMHRDTPWAAAVARYGPTVQAYNVLARGLLSGQYTSANQFTGTDTRRASDLFEGDRLDAGLRTVDRLRVVGARLGATPAQVAVAWVLHQPGIGVALTGIKSPEQADANAAAARLALDTADLKYLEGV